jgi:aspartate racemase
MACIYVLKKIDIAESLKIMKKILGILGGMGPLATADLFKKVVLLTEAERDQNHIHILVDSNPLIPDRTAFLAGHGENPLRYLVDSAKRLESMKANCIIMPCNTAHYFYDDIVKEINTPFLNMIEETAKKISRKHGHIKKAGLLATAGTCNSGLYEKVFTNYGIEIAKPDKKHQDHIVKLILNVKKGRFNMDISGIYETIDNLKDKNAEIFILGCTELPIAFQVFNIKEKTVDPTAVLAESAIRFMGKKVRQDA